MTPLLDNATYLFDGLHSFWKKPRTHRVVTGGLVLTFLLALAGIEPNRIGVLPHPFSDGPHKPFLCR